MFEAQKAFLSPTLRYLTKDTHTLIAETKASIVPAVLILLIVAVWGLAFIMVEPKFILAICVSLTAGFIAAIYYQHFDKIIITPNLIKYEGRRLWSSYTTITAKRESFHGVRLKEYVTENDSRFEFYNVELLFSAKGLPRVLKVFESRNIGKAQTVAQELCRTLSVRLEFDGKDTHRIL